VGSQKMATISPPDTILSALEIESKKEIKEEFETVLLAAC